MARRLVLCLVLALVVLAAPASSAPVPPVPRRGLPASEGAVSYLEYRLSQELVPARSHESHVTRCPRGTVVTGGGVYLTGGTPADEVASSAPYDGGDRDGRPDDGWFAEVNSGAPGGTMTTYAVCAPFLVTYVSRTATVAPGKRQSATASCPAGETVIGGGARTGGTSRKTTLGATTHAAFFRAWRGSANNGTGRAIEVTAIAVCMRIPTPVGVLTSDGGAVGVGRTSHLDLGCQVNGGRHPTGGGSSVSGGLLGEIAGTRPVDDGSDGDTIPDDAWETWVNNESGGDLTVRTSSVCFS
jgi:hypothetical protein